MRRIFGVAACSLLLLSALTTHAQESVGENIDRWYKVKSSSQFGSDSLFLGGVFLRDTTKPLEVWWAYNEAGITGSLYFMVPNRQDSAYFLFYNKPYLNNDPGMTSRVNLTAEGFDIPHLDTIYFMYVPHDEDGVLSSADRSKARFTGPNRRQGDPQNWNNFDRYSSDVMYSSPLTNQPGNYPPYRRWCVAGWVMENDTRTDTVAFAFEDLTPGDADFDDIVFHVSGVFLNHPPKVEALNITAVPSGTIQAGDSVTLTATVEVDSAGTTLSRDTAVTWSLVGDLASPVGDTSNPGLKLTGTPSSTNTFYGVRAYEDYTVEVSFVDDEGTEYSAEAVIHVDPGPPHHVVIEEDSANIDKWVAKPKEKITISSTENEAVAFAVLRDRFGNLVSKADQSSWDSRGTQVVTVSARSSNRWIGDIRRAGTTDSDDSTQVVATDQRTTVYPEGVLPDSVLVVIASWEPVALRLVKKGTDSLISEIALNTDKSIEVEVQAQHSNDLSKWTVYDAEWELTPGTNTDSLGSANPLPGSAAPSWHYSPLNPGTGQLTLSDPSSNAPDLTLEVAITRAPPSKLDFRLITGPGQRIAGDTVYAELRIENTDGLVPGRYCFTTDSGNRPGLYWDPLGNGGRDNEPTVSSDGSSAIVNPSSLGNSSLPQCFHNGIDTVGFVFYYAPFNRDSTHQLFVRLNELSAQSRPFVLLPGPLDSLDIKRADTTSVADTITLVSPDSSLVLYSWGYDRFGNNRGVEQSNWQGTGTLHQGSQPDTTHRFYYATDKVSDNEYGHMRATAVFTPEGTTAADSTYLVVIGPLIHMDNAYTRDLNGDGYLDAIEIHFNKPLSIPDDYNFYDGITIKHGVVTFTNTSIAGKDSTFDSVFVLRLKQDSTLDRPQTSWEPTIALSGLQGVGTIPADANRTCIDGAGPVIWQVLKSIGEAEDRTEDRVKVVFSEKVLAGDGKSLRIDARPGELFRVYERDMNGSYRTVPGMLEGIGNLAAVTADSVVEFYMANGKDLAPRHFLNIDNSSGLTDKSEQKTEAHPDNLKVRVELVGPPPDQLTSFPNPTVPDFSELSPGELYARHDRNARARVRNNGGGTVLTFAMTLPTADEDQGVKAYLKIYDVVGNLVHSAEEPDLVGTIREATGGDELGSVFNVDMYWNISNAQGLPVAPGVYRAIVYLDYASPGHEDARLATNVGVGR